MKVIFLQDVPKVAKAGETREVAAGYGRNFLIPKKLAQLANRTTLGALEAQLKVQTRHQAEEEAKVVGLVEELDGKEITLKAKVGTTEHLYGSITSADIADELQKSYGVSVDKKKVEMAEPIRQLGSYEVAIKFGKDLTPKIKVNVIGEEESSD